MLAEVVGPEPGQASGLKMCFAAYNKGNAALLASTLVVAQQFGVRAIIHDQMARRGYPAQAEAQRFIESVAPKAWRWVAEMREISETFGTTTPKNLMSFAPRFKTLGPEWISSLLRWTRRTAKLD